jgi:hypothetical protein
MEGMGWIERVGVQLEMENSPHSGIGGGSQRLPFLPIRSSSKPRKKFCLFSSVVSLVDDSQKAVEVLVFVLQLSETTKASTNDGLRLESQSIALCFFSTFNQNLFT